MRPKARAAGAAARRSVPPRRLVVISALALLAVGVAGGLVAGLGGASGDRPGPARWSLSGKGLVGYPSFLPKWTLKPGAVGVLSGAVTKPALTSEGDTVKVVTPRWSVYVTVTGPEVPGEGLPYQAPSTTCTWTVEMSGASSAVPVSVSDFDSIDTAGKVFHPYLVPGQIRPPGVLEPGKTLIFELRTGEPVGEGLMRFAPIGRRIVAKWDFIVEND